MTIEYLILLILPNGGGRVHLFPLFTHQLFFHYGPFDVYLYINKLFIKGVTDVELF